MEREDLYIKIKEYIAKCIFDGTYREGKKIPSERALADTLGVSRVTIRKSLGILEKEALVEREVGSGTKIRFSNKGNHRTLDMITLVAPARNPFFSEFIDELQRTMDEEGVLLLYVQKPEQEKMEDCLFRLYQRGLRNAVIWPVDIELQEEKIKRLRAMGMNMVFFDSSAGGGYADTVYLDNEEAIKELTAAMRQEEKEPEIYIGWDNQQIYSVKKRQETYEHTMGGNGKIYQLSWSQKENMDLEVQTIMKQLEVNEKLVSIVCGDGEIGLAAGKVLKELGWGNAALASIDEFPQSKEYGITTIRQDFKMSARIVYQSIKNQCDSRIPWRAGSFKVHGTCIRRRV